MLVLSRKLKEKIVLPTLSIAIQVVEIGRGVVRLGIEAPPEVSVLREEVADRAAEWVEEKTHPDNPAAEVRKLYKFERPLCERLTTTGMGLGLLRLQLDAGLIEEAAATLARIQDDFQLLRYSLEGEMENAAPKPLNNERTDNSFPNRSLGARSRITDQGTRSMVPKISSLLVEAWLPAMIVCVSAVAVAAAAM